MNVLTTLVFFNILLHRVFVGQLKSVLKLRADLGGRERDGDVGGDASLFRDSTS